MFHMESPSIAEVAQECSVSSSIVYKNIEYLNEFLINYDLEVRLSPLRLSGNEKQIRFFYKQFFWFVFHGLKWPFNNISEQELADIIQQEAPFLLTGKTNILRESILFDIAIIVSRRRNKQFISSQVSYFTNSPLNKIICSAGALQNINTPKEYQLLERSYHIALLEGDSPLSKDFNLMQELLYFYRDQNSIPYQLMIYLMEIISRFLTSTDFTIINTISFKMNVIRLFSQLFYFKGEKKFFFPLLNKEENCQNPFLVNLLDFLVKELINYCPELSHDLVSLKQKLKNLLANYISFTKYLPEIIILLDNDISPLRERIIYQIKSLNYNCIFIEYPDCSQDYDLLLSNSIVLNLECDKFFMFSYNELTAHDCVLLEQKLKHITHEKLKRP
nr:helix-turn-helix domain-containing protein [Listeria valentina]